MNYPHVTRDSKGNIIHQKNSNGYEYWREYDSNDNVIHYKDSIGEEEWWAEYDSSNNAIHYKNSDGYEWWKEYDLNGNVIHYKNSKGDDEWYDSNGKKIPNPAPTVELTLDDIAKRFNISVESIRIKKEL